jgi:diguanylate cyclase (GGDEF)-like protein/PAS domain S-box-containing protein
MALLVAAAVIFLVGCLASVRERLSTLSLSFFILTLSIAAWTACTAAAMAASTALEAETWSKALYLGVCAIPAALFQFAAALADRMRRYRRAVVLGWVISAIFAALFVRTEVLLTGVLRYEWGWYPRLGLAGVTFIAYLGAMLAASVLVLTERRREEITDQHRRRLGAFLVALALGYGGVIDFLPSYGIGIYPLGVVPVLGFIALSVRAIGLYRFVDLTPAFVADQLLQTMEGGVLVVDSRGTIRVANDKAAEMLASAREKLVGVNLAELLRVPVLPATTSQTFSRSGRTHNRPMTWKRVDDSELDVSVSATMLRDRDSLPVGILYVLHDLAERRRAERHEFAANHDPLTGLPNRAYLARRFEALHGEAVSRGRVTAVAFIDLDGFKAVNDEHGHGVGDRLLEIVASRFRNVLREEDVLVRHGGDEFVAVLSLGREADAPIVARKLTDVLREPLLVGSKSLRVGASVGVAVAPRDGTDLDPLVAAADQAMYRSKRGQRAPSRAPQTDRVAPSVLSSESRA